MCFACGQKLTGSSKNSHPVKLIAKKLACPLSPNSMLLHRFAWKDLQKTAISVRMAACIGQQHWSKGRWGIRCDVTTCRRMALCFEEPGKFFWFMDVQTQAWTNSLLHLPKPQSKHTFIFKPATRSVTHETKTQQMCFIWFMDVQTQARTISLLHMPKPQSKHTFIFTVAPHKQRSNIAACASHVGKNWRSETVCVLHGAPMWNVPRLQKQNCSVLLMKKKGGTNTVFCTVHVQCTHSAPDSARHSARPQNAVSTKYFPKNDENTQERQHVSPTA